jgi:hypothetical protein
VRIELDGLDSQPLSVDLPPSGPDDEQPQQVRIRAVSQVSGVVAKEPQGLRLSDVRAGRAELDRAVLWFGSVQVAFADGSELSGIGTELQPRNDHVHLDLDVAALSAGRLDVDVVGTAEVGAATELADARLEVRGKKGIVRAPSARFSDFRLKMPAITIEAPSLAATQMEVGWGPGKFLLRAEELRAEELRVSARGTQITLRDVSVAALSVEDGDLAVDRMRVGTARVELDLPEAPVDVVPDGAVAEAAAPGREQGPPILDPHLLDGLAGHLHADLDIATTVPVVQRRRATHRFRIEVDDGAIDYRALEADLALVEEQLLDFSLRDDVLVLELGLPLLPTRGYGKPLVRWPLPADEVALARQRRVRLSRLLEPQARRGAGDGDQPAGGGSGESLIELIELDLQLRDVDLALRAPPRPLDAVVRSLGVGSLRLGGTVQHHRTEGPRPGELSARADALSLELRELPVNDKHLRLEGLRIDAIDPVRLAFEDLRPRRGRAELRALSIDRVRLAGP